MCGNNSCPCGANATGVQSVTGFVPVSVFETPVAIENSNNCGRNRDCGCGCARDNGCGCNRGCTRDNGCGCNRGCGCARNNDCGCNWNFANFNRCC